MGLDKYENEDLIQWGWPEDVWFHVDKVSSAHVYLRLQEDQTLDDIPANVLEDAAQLVKANSIQGNKMNDVDVVYTLWGNLKKTDGMDVGQVGFYKEREVRKIRVAKRINEVINRLNKTKTEVKNPDLRKEREDRDRAIADDKKREQREQREREKQESKRKMEEAQMRSYDILMKEENMCSNRDGGNDSDDFM